MTPKEKALWTAIVVVLGGVGYATYHYLSADVATAPPVKAEPPPEPVADESGIQNPVPVDGASAVDSKPLPQLGESDADFAAALTLLGGADSVGTQLVRDNIIRNLVVTVDNLPRQKVAVERRPVQPTPGQTLTEGDADAGEVATLSVQNYARYAPFVNAIKAADSKQAAALYFHWYPLFQKAYEDLGYPDKYFNDRLVAAIDDMLKAPTVEGPVRLVRPRVFYEFADPAIESRSAGQKLLIRMGPDNAAIIKSKLRELRVQIANHKP